MIPEMGCFLEFEVSRDPGAGGCTGSGSAGVGGAGVGTSFLTTKGAVSGVSGWVLITVFGATMEVDFLGTGGRVSVVDRVMSGPCSIGSALAGCDEAVVAAVSRTGLCEDGGCETCG